jgi:guanosine-3',5'-bis(diphosphate) 3'-pyrophosphohydrolase
MKIKPPEEQLEMERAIIMMVDCIKRGCRNNKPLILHSLRVGFKLWETGEPKEVIIAGFLHDLLEDTNCKAEEIKEKFGDKVLNHILACTATNTEDTDERWFKFMEQIKRAGREAIVIKIVDSYENLPYVHLIEDEEYLKRILWKHKITIEQLGPEIDDLPIFKQYCEKYEELAKEYGIEN